MSITERMSREARRAVAEAIGASYERRRFEVEKFGRHRDGYLHARVLVEGQPVYFHRRFGSWLAPGTNGLLKEPEALLGTDLGRELKYELSHQSTPFDNADRKRREAENARSRAASDAGVGDATPGHAGVPAGGSDPGTDDPLHVDS